MNQRSVVASANIGSQRTGYVNIIHYDTGGKTVRVDFTQAAAAPYMVYSLSCFPTYFAWDRSEVTYKDCVITSVKIDYAGGQEVGRTTVPFTWSLEGTDSVRFNVNSYDNKTLRISPRGLNNTGVTYNATLWIYQTGTSEKYSCPVM